MKYTICILNASYDALSMMTFTNLKEARKHAKFISQNPRILNCWIIGQEKIKTTKKIMALEEDKK